MAKVSKKAARKLKDRMKKTATTKAAGGVGVNTRSAAEDTIEKAKKTIKPSQRGKSDSKSLKMNLNKSSQDHTGYRTTDKYDKLGHNERLFRGDRAQTTAATSARNLGRVGTEAKDNFNLAGGWKTAAGHAGAGAIAGGVAGAGVNVIRGEDAWEGAKTGAMLGAVGNGGVHSARMGMGASKGQKFGNAFTSFNAETGMTKSVKSLHTLAKDSRYANRILKKSEKLNKK